MPSRGRGAPSSDFQVIPPGELGLHSENAGTPSPHPSLAPSPFALLGWLVFLKFPLSLGGLSGTETVLLDWWNFRGWASVWGLFTFQ